MERIVRFIQRRYRFISSAALAVMVVAVFAAGRITIVTDAKEMLPQSNPYVKSYNRITEEFSSATLLLTVEGSDRGEMIRAARFLSGSIQDDPRMMADIRAVNLHMDRDFIYRWALMMQERGDLEKLANLLGDFSLPGFFRAFNDSLEDTYAGDGAEEEINSSREERETAGFLADMGEAARIMTLSLEDPSRYSPEAAASDVADLLLLGDIWNFDRTGKMLIFSLTPDFQIDDIPTTVRFMENLQEHLKAARGQWPDLTFGYAGDVPQNYDEQIALGSDTVLPSLIALLTIMLLFLFSFRQTRVVVMAVGALVFGILSTVLVVSLTLGALNLLTSLFAVLLIGLGIDFGIHFITNFDRYTGRGMTAAEAIKATYVSTAGAILLGALTTSLAFFSLLLTDSAAIRQFGLVAGTGVLLTLLAEMVILPSLILLIPGKTGRKTRLPVVEYRGISKIGSFMERKRWWVVFVTAAVLAVLVPQLSHLEYTYDMSELGPQKSVSVMTQRKIEALYGLSPLPVMAVVDTVERAAVMTEAAKNVPSVGAVSSISEIVKPEELQDENLAIIESLRESWAPAPTAPLDEANREDLLYEVQRLEWNMIEIGDLSVAALGEGNMVQRQRDEMIREIRGAERGAPGDERFSRLIQAMETADGEHLNRFQRLFATEMNKRALQLLSPARRLTPADVPQDLRSGMVSDRGNSFLVVVSPDAGTASKEGLFRFRAAMEEIDPGFTGTIPIFVEWTASIQSEVDRATLLIAAVFIILMLVTFRNLVYTAVAAFTLGTAAVIMLALFPLMDIQFNATNLMVMPLIFGLGIAFQIHIIHRFLQVRSLETAFQHSGKGVLLSALTTMIGFGSLALMGEMEAARELGTMLFTGIGINLISTFTLLPALLSLLNRRNAGTGRKINSVTGERK